MPDGAVRVAHQEGAELKGGKQVALTRSGASPDGFGLSVSCHRCCPACAVASVAVPSAERERLCAAIDTGSANPAVGSGVRFQKPKALSDNADSSDRSFHSRLNICKGI